MNATIATDRMPVTAHVSPGGGVTFLIASVPEGWDDVKKIMGKVLTFNGEFFKFTGWDSDKGEAYFKKSTEIARVIS